MNCSACGGGASATGASTMVCGTCLGSGASSSSAGPSTATARPAAPLRGRRWLLRRAGARKEVEQPPSHVAASFEAEVRRKMDVAVHAAVAARSSRRFSVERDAVARDIECEFDDDRGHLVETDMTALDMRAVEPQLRPLEVDLHVDEEGDEEDVDVDADADAGSMEVSAAQSETASTVSRAAFSVSDKTELEARDGGAILAGVASREDRGNAQRRSRAKDDARAQLRTAYVRELLLSSLSL